LAKRFNPYGLHAIHIPLALVNYDGATETRKSLSWGAKVLYGRLALFLGRPKSNSESFCSPSLETVASAMATSVDTIGRWLRELIESRLH
jgi:Helix-turn-helix domain